MLILNEQKILEDSAVHSRNIDKIMTFKEFVRFNKINLDEIFVDKLFYNIDGNLPIYMDENMIEYFGYKGTASQQKQSILKLIDVNFKSVKSQLLNIYSNVSYKNYLKNSDKNPNISKIYPSIITKKCTSATKHILVHPKLFKEMLMMCQTEKGKQIRLCYIDMMDTLSVYLRYQNTVALRSKDDKIQQLLLRMDTIIDKQDQTNTILTETYVKLTVSEVKADDFRKKLDKVLPERVDMNDIDDCDVSYVYILRDKDATPKEHNLYVMRTQKKNYNSSLKKIKSDFGDQIVRTLTIKHPNAITFWKTIKKKYASNIIKDSNTNWFSLNEMTLREFKINIKEMDEARRQ
jgi:hypothetical protein